MININVKNIYLLKQKEVYDTPLKTNKLTKYTN